MLIMLKYIHMQPDTPQQNLPTPSMDYLNQIASPTPQKTMNPIVLWAAIGTVLLLAIVIFFLIISGGTNNSDRMTVIAARITGLQTIVENAPEYLQSSELRTQNSNLSLALASASRDIGGSIEATGASTNEKDDRINTINKEFEEISSNLEDARLNGIYDRAYAREMAYSLKTLHAEMDALYQATGKDTVREFLRSTDENLAPFIEEFSSFTGN